MQSSKRSKRKLSIVFRDPSEIPHRKGNFIINNNIGINSMALHRSGIFFRITIKCLMNDIRYKWKKELLFIHWK